MDMEPFYQAVKTFNMVMFFFVLPVLTMMFRNRFRRMQSFFAKEWRRIARDYAILGEQQRSEFCHAKADWFELPWWQAIMTKRPK